MKVFAPKMLIGYGLCFVGLHKSKRASTVQYGNEPPVPIFVCDRCWTMWPRDGESQYDSSWPSLEAVALRFGRATGRGSKVQRARP